MHCALVLILSYHLWLVILEADSVGRCIWQLKPEMDLLSDDPYYM